MKKLLVTTLVTIFLFCFMACGSAAIPEDNSYGNHDGNDLSRETEDMELVEPTNTPSPTPMETKSFGLTKQYG